MLAIQLMYVDPQRRDVHAQTYLALVEDVLDASPSSRRLLEPIDEMVQAGKYYQALKTGKELLAFERELLSHVR